MYLNFLHSGWLGRNSFVCAGTKYECITGPAMDDRKSRMALGLIFFLLILYCIVLFIYRDKFLNLFGLPVTICTVILIVLSMIFFCATRYTEPGILPRKQIIEKGAVNMEQLANMYQKYAPSDQVFPYYKLTQPVVNPNRVIKLTIQKIDEHGNPYEEVIENADEVMQKEKLPESELIIHKSRNFCAPCFDHTRQGEDVGKISIEMIKSMNNDKVNITCACLPKSLQCANVENGKMFPMHGISMSYKRIIDSQSVWYCQFSNSTNTGLKWCHTCEILRLPNASHCAQCDNCVTNFDHHCNFIGNCIGTRNHSSFIRFCFTLSFGLLMIIAQNCWFLANQLEKLELSSFEYYCVISCVIAFICGASTYVYSFFTQVEFFEKMGQILSTVSYAVFWALMYRKNRDISAIIIIFLFLCWMFSPWVLFNSIWQCYLGIKRETLKQNSKTNKINKNNKVQMPSEQQTKISSEQFIEPKIVQTPKQQSLFRRFFQFKAPPSVLITSWKSTS